ncbi:MAG: nucleic acid binding, OB-fold, tRNA/helicase-type [Betaproteobacteria bacterium]|nr:nucleic acid binding, OB-fold, tRNA/helicase-type [Betaproteobacteria bacterium]
MLKRLQILCLALLFSLAQAADKPAAAPAGETVRGEVLETMDSGGFTYMRLKTKNGEMWSAVRAAPVKAGAQVTVENGMTMKNFESKTLKRTFPSIVLGDLGGAAKNAAGASPHAASAAQSDAPDVKVDKARGANARTIAEVNTKSGELKDKPVVVRGKVVKYNGGIMGKNWIHLRDGSGADAEGSNDLLATSSDQAKVGDIVTVEGVVRTDKDFGSGYAYKVMIEDAKIKN